MGFSVLIIALVFDQTEEISDVLAFKQIKDKDNLYMRSL